MKKALFAVFCAPVAAEALTVSPTFERDYILPGVFVNGQPLAPAPFPGSLREVVWQAHNQSPSTEVIIELQGDKTYLLDRSTTFSGIHMEGSSSFDEWHGDLDIRRSLTIDGKGATIDAQRLGRIFQISGSVQVTLKNLTLKGGGFASLDGGGALRISGGANVVLENVRFEDHLITTSPSGAVRGGAVYISENAAGQVRIAGCHFENCRVVTVTSSVSAQGGAIDLESGPLTIEGTTFRQCHVWQNAPFLGAEARGGAIFAGGGQLTLVTSRFEENSTLTAPGAPIPGNSVSQPGAASEGGAVYLVGTVVEFGADRTVFVGNTAKAGRGSNGTLQTSGGTGGLARGGALFIAPGSNIPLPLKDCELRENLAFAGPGGNATDAEAGFVTTRNGGQGGNAFGGAIFADRGQLDLPGTSLVENSAIAGDGGSVERVAGEAGGKGGDAAGGAIYATSQAVSVSITGQLQVLDADQEHILSTALLHGNTALAGGGKPGLGNHDGNDAGRGGTGQGGALAIFCSKLTLTRVLARQNNAQGGVGADGLVEERRVIILGGSGGESQDALFGQGGSNGPAYGGAVYTGATDATVTDSTFLSNRAIGSRVVGRVLHLVGSENNGERSLSLPDSAFPLIAGRGAGLISGGNGACHGGNGGNAAGGAVYGHAGHIAVTGTSFVTNEAIGGNGGAGGAVLGSGGVREGGRGGGGADARGGALYINLGQTFDIRESLLSGNLAMAGRGGSGGKGGDAPADEPMLGGTGGAGGKGGNAFGGAIFSIAESDSPQTGSVTESCYIFDNKVFGGDGSYGGNGGIGKGGSTDLDADQGGGMGGNGGAGGIARGGGIYAVQLHLRKSTVDRNLVSSGWGGSGGHGSAGTVFGGIGGLGGAGGDATGGGVAFSGGTRGVAYAELSTFSYNRVHSGTGGTGGHGGLSHFVGGTGLHGGNAGVSRGGGIWIDGTSSQLEILNSTVAGNLVEGGSGGFRGLRMVNSDAFSYSTVPTRYHAGVPPMVSIDSILYPGPPFKSGSTSFFVDQKNYPIGSPPRTDLVYSPPVSLQGSGFQVGFDQDMEAIISGASFGATVPFLAGGLASGGVAVGIVGMSAGATVFGGGGAAAAAGGLGLMGAFTVAGPWVAGGSGLAIGAIVGVKFFTAGALTGDWEAAAAWALGSPGDVNRNDLSLLLTGTGPRSDDDDLPMPQAGQDGNAGAGATPEGSGIYGKATLQNTLVSNNIGQRRVRPTTARTIDSVRVIEYTEQNETAQVYDFQGQGTSSGGLFVASATGLSAHATDEVGLLATPLDAKIANAVGIHGGSVPTLKLLPGSPARNAQPTGTNLESQNGYLWTAGSTRDVGAWGALPNRAPVAVTRYIRIRRGETAHFTPGQVFEMQTDPDNDDLSFASYSHITGNGSWNIINVTNAPLTSSYSFTPSAGFPDIGPIFEFRTTDGELSSAMGYIMLQVLPDPAECTGTSNGNVLLLSGSEQYVRLPDSAQSDHNFTGPFTVEFWFGSLAFGTPPEHEAFVTKGDSAWRVQRLGTTKRVAFDITGLSPLTLASVSELEDGRVHHIAAVYDGNYKYLYIDGRLEASAAVTGTPATNAYPVWIGANAQRDGRNAAGVFDDVRIWSRARSHAEIRAGATRTLDGHGDGLLTMYRFDEPDGPAVYNSAVNGSPTPGTFVLPAGEPRRFEFSIEGFGTAVLGRHLFYNESGLDGNDPAADDSDDGAIAGDKAALLPGGAVPLVAGPATAAHRSGFGKGINGIMIDIAGLAQPAALDLEDFSFQQGVGGDPGTWDPTGWTDAPLPRTLLVRQGVGPCGSDRVSLVWDAADSGTAHAALTDAWLRVVLKANDRTGLLSDEVFYFGHGTGAPNNPPVFSGYSLAVSSGRTATVSLAKLLARASDSDGHVLSLTGVSPVSTAGGGVVLGTDSLTYTPPSGFTGTDTFDVTIRDEAGASAIGMVTVDVIEEDPDDHDGNLASVELADDGRVSLLFYGIPGRTYMLQFSTDLINWVDRHVVTATPGGRIQYLDTPPVESGGSGFYRTFMQP